MSTLDDATTVLDGGTSLRGPVATRAAAFLARHALECLVRELCAAHGVVLVRVTERTRLLVLRRTCGDEVADLACAAWHGLSGACHHHAYELSPSANDVRHWLGLVTKLDSMRSLS